MAVRRSNLIDRSFFSSPASSPSLEASSGVMGLSKENDCTPVPVPVRNCCGFKCTSCSLHVIRLVLECLQDVGGTHNQRGTHNQPPFAVMPGISLLSLITMFRVESSSSLSDWDDSADCAVSGATGGVADDDDSHPHGVDPGERADGVEQHDGATCSTFQCSHLLDVLRGSCEGELVPNRFCNRRRDIRTRAPAPCRSRELETCPPPQPVP